MARIVCILGTKGGTGKTTLTHLLAHGLGLLGQRVVAALTDRDRDPLSKAGRLYLPVDARTPDDLARITAKLHGVDGWFGVIDGGGNRPEMDAKLAGLADLVLLPFRDSHEDMRSLVRDLSRVPRSHAIPFQWPTNLWQREAADRAVAQQLGGYASRILAPVPALSATKLLLQLEIPASLPSSVNSAARSTALRVLAMLGISSPRRLPDVLCQHNGAADQ